jgi:hypothetical protein
MVLSPARPSVTPERVLALDTAYQSSKVVLSAVELGDVTAIAARPAAGDELAARLGLHEHEAGLFGPTTTPPRARA